MIGPLRKLKGVLDDDGNVHYSLPIGATELPLNNLVGKEIEFAFTGSIYCICGKNKPIKKSFQQGYCFPCTRTLASCDICIVRPERCHHHLGTCREPEWGDANCFIEHTVYASNSSGLKVGITRTHQQVTRWIDQGASQALALMSVKNRLNAGLIEVELAKSFADKTNWRRLLSGPSAPLDLHGVKEKIIASLGDDVPWQPVSTTEPVSLHYPVLEYPLKVSSINLDKTPRVSGVLMGIKGQYLIVGQQVINMRKYQGYEVDWQVVGR